MVDVRVIDDETEISLASLLFLSGILHLCQLLLAQTELVLVGPGGADGVQTGVSYDGLQIGIFIIVRFFALVRDEYIDTDFAFGLETVGSEPPQVMHIVYGIHIVVIGRVERHAHVVGAEVAVAFRIIPGDENVVSSEAFLTLGGIIERDAVGCHERIVQVGTFFGNSSLERFGSTPPVYQSDAGIKGCSVAGCLGDDFLVVHLIGVAGSDAVLVHAHGSCLAAQFECGKELVLVDHETVYHHHLFGTFQHTVAQT